MNKIFTIMFLLISTFGLSQNNQKDTIYLDKYFKDVESRLLIEEVFIFNNVKSNELINRFEDFSNKNFKDYNKVDIKKDVNKITLNYIQDTDGKLNFYVMLIIDFKDDSIRIRAYDDGNVFDLGNYYNTAPFKEKYSHTFFLSDYFTNNLGIVQNYLAYNKTPGIFNTLQGNAEYLNSHKNSLQFLIRNINTFLSKPKQTQDTW